jgi:hypothetical protein
MTTRRARKGTMEEHETPDWEPLRAVAGDELLEYFMWMYEVRLRDGTRIQAYKNITTRGYVHLARDGDAYAYEGEQRYRPLPAERVFWRIAMDLHHAFAEDELQRDAMLAAVGHCERREARRAVPG